MLYYSGEESAGDIYTSTWWLLLHHRPELLVPTRLLCSLTKEPLEGGLIHIYQMWGQITVPVIS